MKKEIYVMIVSLKEDLETGEYELFFHETGKHGKFVEDMDKKCYIEEGYLNSEIPTRIEVGYNCFYGGIMAQQGFEKEPSKQEKISIRNNMIHALKDFLIEDKQKMISEFDEKIKVCTKGVK